MVVRVLLSFCLCAPAFGSEAVDTLEQAWQVIRDRFYDDDLHGVDWDAMLEAYRPLAREARDEGELHQVINDMLSNLEASHLALLDGEIFKGLRAALDGDRVSTLGLELENNRGLYFVRSMYEGGPAERAGLKVGDRIVEVDGIAISESVRLRDAGYDPGLPGDPLFRLMADSSDSVRLKIQTDPDSSSQKVLEVRPRPMSAVDAWRNSLRVYRSGQAKIAYMHLWYMAPMGMGARVGEVLSNELADADALILDLRGRGGYASEVDSLLSCFRGSRRRAPLWSKPVVALIDERTRSAKEMFSYYFRKYGIGDLVGRRTEGAVLGAEFKRLIDGSVLMYPGVAVPVSGGLVLEGRGVRPDFEVDRPIEYVGGKDPVLEKGLAVALARIRSR